jgi:hypothetical protein
MRVQAGKPHRRTYFLKVIAVSLALIIVVIAIWYFTKDNHTNSVEQSDTHQSQSTGSATSPEDKTTTNQPAATDSSTGTNGTAQTQSSTSAATSPEPSTSNSSYDPHACDSYKAAADSLKTASDQKKATYDTAFNQQKSYGDFYDAALQQYGTAAAGTVADQEYKQQKDYLTQLQTDWSSSLTDYTDAYSAFQACTAKNLGLK